MRGVVDKIPDYQLVVGVSSLNDVDNTDSLFGGGKGFDLNDEGWFLIGLDKRMHRSTIRSVSSFDMEEFPFWSKVGRPWRNMSAKSSLPVTFLMLDSEEPCDVVDLFGATLMGFSMDNFRFLLFPSFITWKDTSKLTQTA